jgi:proteasome alpha subunit
MQIYTMFGGARPYGSALLIAGVNGNTGRLFETDPSGTLLEYKATGIGTGRPAVMKVFEEEFNESASLEEAALLGLKALHAATEGKLDVNTVEMGFVDATTGTFRKMERDEIGPYINKFSQ